jgi:hypothetical protein
MLLTAVMVEAVTAAGALFLLLVLVLVLVVVVDAAPLCGA